MSTELHSSERVAPQEPLPVFLPEQVRRWNETGTPYPRTNTVAQLFEETAAAFPDAVALSFGDQQLSYRKLNARANRLAHRLRLMGVGPETMVGCCLERSPELVVAFIAVLKAGGAYVPVDVSYPKERFDFLIADTRTPLLLTQKSLVRQIPAGSDVPLLCLDDDAKAVESSDDSNPPPAGSPSSLAYVMYTSGSTGRPKGVMVENRAIVRLVRNTDFCRFGSDEIFLMFAPVSFDASTLEIWGPLLNGGRLVIMPPQACSLEDLGEAIRRNGVTVLWLTAGLFHLMVDQRLEALRPVRQLLAGGDVLSPRHVRAVLEAFPDCTLINGYGPTENTTFTCCHSMRYAGQAEEPIPIGRPISNTRVYILDEQMRPLPAGETGELYAGGDGVARGYLNRPEVTAEKFLPDPYSEEPGARMYRTGDRARWREDGVVEFLGRLDDQVKVLGHRIEPGEIETVLGTHEGIGQVCVVPQTAEDGSKRIVAYYVARQKGNASPQELRRFLAGRLPQYMIPAWFVQLDAFPLSPNGKVDRAALPAPALGANGEGVGQAPTTGTEQKILDVWKRILRVDQLGIDDNFFDLGGDSLLLVAVHSNLQKLLQIEIEVTDLFEFTTIRALAQHLAGKKAPAKALQESEDRAAKQREAFARQRERRQGCMG